MGGMEEREGREGGEGRRESKRGQMSEKEKGGV